MRIKQLFLSILVTTVILSSVQKMQALSFGAFAKEIGLYSLLKQIVISSALGNSINYWRILKQGCSAQSSLSAIKTIGLYSGYGMAAGAAYNLYWAYQDKNCTCKKPKCECESNRVKSMTQRGSSAIILTLGSAYLIAKLYGN